jgi:hypothetical protein
MAVGLQDVFGVPPLVKSYSYVDRGGLDERLRYALSTPRVVIIHGDSKQGKTWLRQHVLAEDECLDVQCQVGATPASLLTQALGLLGAKAVLQQTAKHDLAGTIDLSTTGDLGIKVLARLRLRARLMRRLSRSTERQLAPVGQTPGDLAWVAKILCESGKRVVIEDFHYLEEDSKRQFAFLLKALGDYGVHPIIIGVWSQNHLLTYYNGDLSQRVEDIHLVWTPPELEAVLNPASTPHNHAVKEACTTASELAAARDPGHRHWRFRRSFAARSARADRTLARTADRRRPRRDATSSSTGARVGFIQHEVQDEGRRSIASRAGGRLLIEDIRRAVSIMTTPFGSGTERTAPQASMHQPSADSYRGPWASNACPSVPTAERRGPTSRVAPERLAARYYSENPRDNAILDRRAVRVRRLVRHH